MSSVAICTPELSAKEVKVLNFFRTNQKTTHWGIKVGGQFFKSMPLLFPKKFLQDPSSVVYFVQRLEREYSSAVDDLIYAVEAGNI